MINSKEYWENRYAKGGNSGNGSYGYLAEYKADVINTFIKNNGVTSILEFGCGDGNNLSLIKCQNKIGVDVSRTALNLCAQKNKGTFILYNEFKPVTVDLTVSMDVIYHLIEDDVYNDYMDKLTSNNTKHLIIYASDYDKDYASHMKSRKFTNHPLLTERFELVQMTLNLYPFDGVKGSVSDWYIFKQR